ncbi:type II toxin-antitoxin system RelE/ParE family toxin [Flavobacterium sp. D11R37]|uniref:type II toxin-antitoxin system RelE/ParE family toxin n=1 Tax=Flavobacterium coralii TaxID=2838017 RepID=UPI001CA6CA77|nr:type II toxin-antitoxin system RelE/ParE family toxin [Flavobacterium coralii]MBY8962444.1 type II toxin-antitoxin system RelE/ParE family toxin [Flavobacterium coralii]
MKVIITKEAKAELKASAEWYESRQKGLGKRFLKTIKDEVSFLRKNPDAAVTQYKDVRTTVVSVFPYLIHYYVKEDSIIIIGVLHTSLNPVNRK